MDIAGSMVLDIHEKCVHSSGKTTFVSSNNLTKTVSNKFRCVQEIAFGLDYMSRIKNLYSFPFSSIKVYSMKPCLTFAYFSFCLICNVLIGDIISWLGYSDEAEEGMWSNPSTAGTLEEII